MIITLTKDEVLKATQEYLINNFTLSATIDVTKVVESYLADKVFNGTVPVNLSIEFKDDSVQVSIDFFSSGSTSEQKKVYVKAKRKEPKEVKNEPEETKAEEVQEAKEEPVEEKKPTEVTNPDTQVENIFATNKVPLEEPVKENTSIFSDLTKPNTTQAQDAATNEAFDSLFS